MVVPHWRIWVDWDDDGVWGESNEDVTSEVMELRWEWGRSLDTERAHPALLELKLRNDDHKYSPSNGNSPLFGNLKAGRRVWAQLAYPYDDFSGADGTDLDSRVTPVDGNFAWVKENNGAKGFEIDGGQARAVVGGASDAIYTLDLGDADARIGFKFNRATNAGSGVALRFIDTTDYLRVHFASASTTLEDITGGAATLIRSGDPLTAGVNYFVEIEMHGESIRLFVTDLDSGSVVRHQILDGAGIAGNITATRHGLWHNASANTDRWDDFGGWRSFFCGALESIAPQPGRSEQRCALIARDELEHLRQTLLFTLLAGTNLRSDNIISDLLSWAGFSVDHRHLDGGRTLIAATPRALWRESAAEALFAAQQEEDGFIYIDGLGYFRLEGSGHRNSGPHTTARAIFNDTRASSPYLSGLTWEDGSKGVENDVTFRYHLTEDLGLQEIWRLRDVPAIPPGESRDFLAESDVYDVVDSIGAPVANLDYTANSQADGAGIDLTADIAVSLPLSSTYQGKGTVARVTNNHASTTSYITFLRLQADFSHQNREATIYQSQDATSQGAHGVRSKLVNCRYIDTYMVARDVTEDRLARKKDSKPRLTLTIRNGDSDNLRQMTYRVISDRIKVVYSDMGINQDFFIEHMTLDAIARTGEITMRWLTQGA